jgi:uncharacterized membrane protein (UPF0127 family)
MNIIIKHNLRNIEIQNVKKLSEIGKISGLMFHCRKKCPAMLFEFKRPTRMSIHSLFVFFKFAAVWLDDKNRIIDLKMVKPFRFSVSCKEPFNKLLEIPLNREYHEKVKILFDKH